MPAPSVAPANPAVEKDLLRHVMSICPDRVLDLGDEPEVRRMLRAVDTKVFWTDTFDADAQHLPFRDNTFDVVYARDLLHRVQFDSAFPILAEMARVARRRLVLSFATGLLYGQGSLQESCYPNGYRHTFSFPMLRVFLGRYGFISTRQDFAFSPDAILIGDRTC